MNHRSTSLGIPAADSSISRGYRSQNEVLEVAEVEVDIPKLVQVNIDSQQTTMSHNSQIRKYNSDAEEAKIDVRKEYSSEITTTIQNGIIIEKIPPGENHTILNPEDDDVEAKFGSNQAMNYHQQIMDVLTGKTDKISMRQDIVSSPA